MQKYIYRRTDNDQLVSVDFETAMSQQGGYITLPDGAEAKRCVYLEQPSRPQADQRENVQPEIVSDTLGVPGHKVEEFRRTAQEQGLRVEFTKDHHEPTFFQARFPSWKARDKYAKYMGLNQDRNSRNGSGGIVSATSLERAKARVLEAHPTA